jgi:23S rRNA pseudouridine2604 synthase
MKKAYQLEQAPDAHKQVFHHQEKASVRVNKYLASSGFCSRRQADKFIEEQRVTIDGVVATVGSQVWEGQVVLVDGTKISDTQNHVYIVLNKPTGITCTLETDKEGNISDFMDYPQRIFPIGRLDKDSSGLILLTSDGDIVNKILRAENNHDKEYIVHVNKDITLDFIKKMAAGVEITNMRSKTRVVTKKCEVKQLGPRSFCIILTQGLNRQIRRMCTELGYSVVALHRERIMNIHLGGLKTGQWRYLTQEELSILNKTL